MWSGTVGLVNDQYKYLTAETFGFKINANGSAMKKKQLWTIEPFPFKSNTALNGNNGNNNNGRPAFNSSMSIDEMDELENVAIKSHLNCYLAVDSYGNVTCEKKELTDQCRFTISICSMTQEGTDEDQISWAFRNVSRGYFLGVSGDDGSIVCNAKMPQSKAELWHIHLVAARGATMAALKSISRKRYARIISAKCNIFTANDANGKGDDLQVQVDALNPWGSETLFQLKYFDNGNYALLSGSTSVSDVKYLTCDGNCIEAKLQQNGAVKAKLNGNGVFSNGQNGHGNATLLPPKNCLFTIEYHGGYIAFRDKAGRYLASSGRQAVLRTRSMAVGKDELFELEPAPLQVAFRATFNNKWVSSKQGMDLSANQNDITHHETFQIDYDHRSDCWHLSTAQNKFWALGSNSTVQINDPNTKERFRMTWNTEDGTCSLYALDASGQLKTIGARKSGQLCTGSAESIRFYIKILNRPSITLRGSSLSSFVGTKQGSVKLESNKTTPDQFVIEYANAENLSIAREDIELIDCTFNCFYLKLASNGKYLALVDGQTLGADASSVACGLQFQYELRGGSLMAIRTYDSNAYLNLTPNGGVILSSCLPEKATLWEF